MKYLVAQLVICAVLGATDAYSQALARWITELEDIKDKLDIAEEYIEKMQDQGQTNVRSDILNPITSYQSLVQDLTNAVNSYRIPEPDRTNGVTAAEVLQATDYRLRRDVVSRGTTQAENDVSLAKSYIDEDKRVSGYIESVTGSRDAASAFLQPLLKLSENLPWDSPIQQTTIVLYKDTLDLVSKMNGLVDALKIKGNHLKAKASSFPQEVSGFLSILQQVSDGECSSINSALSDLGDKIDANKEDLKKVADFAQEWSQHVKRHNQGLTTSQEDQEMQARRQEMLQLGASGSAKANQLRTELNNLKEYHQNADQDYRKLQTLETELAEMQ
ncbi:MAG: hypothetical protein JO025_21735 [Verrucomicrobia bacterium]|nr:hypothetical protein [Verrucomicrobiota bacterium]